MRIIPVVRLVSTEASPFDGESVTALRAALAPAARGADELQIDFDCPDRLVDQYADALGKLHGLAPRLSVTALAGWSRLPAWSHLQASVDELFPMFYDLEPDPPLAVKGPPPLLDLATLKSQLRQWSLCKTPWQAGMPSFARVTLYGAAGRSRGHLRAWTWDDLCFDRALATVAATAQGVTLLRAAESGRLEDTALHAGELVATRWPDRAALSDAEAAARAAGARGVVLFRLPDSTDPSGWSLLQLANLKAEPRLSLRKSGPQQLELTNDAVGDLAPRLSGSAALDRGYALEIDARAPIFRDAAEGDFWRVTGHANPDAAPRPVPVPLATRLTFWFSHLRAHESLRTGLIQLAPGADFGQIRYRVIPGVTEWQSIP
jgi:hypothetical protein